MKAELAAWNNGKGISLESWVGCSGSFSLAIGYATVFWPTFVEHEGFVLRKGFSEESLRSFTANGGRDRRSIETVMNHLHIADIQYVGCKDMSKDKIIYLGNVLRECYTAKLKVQFPVRAFTVSFYQPDDPDDLMAYEISFWQNET
jgi:hypothetical protein